ncbi:MAG TPA: luciferase family protein [Anaerolineales bacterium]
MVAGAGERIRQAALRWPGVQAQPHRFGGEAYLLGGGEIGHRHGDSVVDIPFPRAVRDELVASGQAKPHRFTPPGSGWVTVFLRQPSDVDHAIGLLERVYRARLKRRQSARD